MSPVIHRRITRPEAQNAHQERRDAALEAATEQHPDADRIGLCWYGGRYLAEVWTGKAAQLFEVGL